MVICGQPTTKISPIIDVNKIYLRLFELLCLFRSQHTESCADLHVHLSNFGHHLQDSLKSTFSTGEVPPCGTHTESGASILLRLTRCFENWLDVY
jgi:hypothetical protein